MCRLFGISYDKQYERINTTSISSVLYCSMVHGGPDAWGYMRYDGESVWTHKQPGPATEGLGVLHDHLLRQKNHWFVGHMRKATHGSPADNRNNHPIQHGNIVGIHNGKLINHEDILAVTGRMDPEVEVDSEAIFASVNKWGHAPGLRKIVGAMVTVYVDVRKPHLIHIGRTHERSVTIGWTERGNLIFATEKQALLMLEGYGINFTHFSSVRDMRHLVIRRGQIIHRHTYGEVPPEPPRKPAPWLQRFNLVGVTEEELHAMLDDGDLFYVNGEVVTPDTYIEQLEREESWEW